MKTKFTRLLLLTMAGLIPASITFSQVVIQHSGAADPLTEGFILDSREDVQLGPVLGDSGFDTWMIHSRNPNESAGYYYPLTADEQQATTTYGWVFSANMRFVEVSDRTSVIMSLGTGTTGFQLRLSGNEEGEIVVSGTGGFPVFSLEGNALDYHEYKFVYDAALETAALWIDGAERVTGISGFQTTSALVSFGAPGEDITYSHWNDVTLAIVPEPATVALLSGLGALFCVGIFRWRKRRIR